MERKGKLLVALTGPNEVRATTATHHMAPAPMKEQILPHYNKAIRNTTMYVDRFWLPNNTSQPPWAGMGKTRFPKKHDYHDGYMCQFEFVPGFYEELSASTRNRGGGG